MSWKDLACLTFVQDFAWTFLLPFLLLFPACLSFFPLTTSTITVVIVRKTAKYSISLLKCNVDSRLMVLNRFLSYCCCWWSLKIDSSIYLHFIFFQFEVNNNKLWIGFVDLSTLRIIECSLVSAVCASAMEPCRRNLISVQDGNICVIVKIHLPWEPESM